MRLFALWAGMLMPAGAAAQSGENVLVVINSKSEASVQIGEAYARARAVPQNQVVRLEMSTAETVSRPEYEGTIEGPISAALARHSLQDKVLYIVLTKGVPIRVEGTVAREGTVASVDSELTLLYRKMVGVRIPVPGRVRNSYYLDAKNIAEARYFTRIDSDLYLVTRLDGFTVDDALKLIERGSAPSREGKIVLDQRATIAGRRWRCLVAAGVGPAPEDRRCRSCGPRDEPPSGVGVGPRARVLLLGIERSGESAAQDRAAVRQRRDRRDLRQHGWPDVRGTAGGLDPGRQHPPGRNVRARVAVECRRSRP